MIGYHALILWIVVASGYAYRRRRMIRMAREVERALVPEDSELSWKKLSINPALHIKSETSWHRRLWYAASNPFLYLWKGEMRW